MWGVQQHRVSDLQDALIMEDLDRFKALLNQGANIHQRCMFGFTLLHMAVGRQEFGVEFTMELLDRGADISARDERQKTPLHHACFHGNSKVASLLLDKGADIRAKDDMNWTPIQWACESCSIETMKLLIAKGADFRFQDYDEDNGNTLLHRVYRDLLVAKALVGFGLDVNRRNLSLQTPLHCACQKGNDDLVRYLLDVGACVHVRDKDGRTPLHLAHSYEFSKKQAGDDPFRAFKICVMLLNEGADIYDTDSDYLTKVHDEFVIEKFDEKWSTNPLLEAMSHKKMGDFKSLLEDESECIIDENVDEEWSILHAAAILNRHEYIDVLARSNRAIDVFKQSSGKLQTAFHFACAKGNLKAVQSLGELAITVYASFPPSS